MKTASSEISYMAMEVAVLHTFNKNCVNSTVRSCSVDLQHQLMLIRIFKMDAYLTRREVYCRGEYLVLVRRSDPLLKGFYSLCSAL